jgi:hypothetical protein
MLERNATPPHGQEIILHMGTFMDSQYPNATYVNFGDGFTGSDIGGFAEQPSGELYALDSIGCFHPFVEHTLQAIMETKNHGLLMRK